MSQIQQLLESANPWQSLQSDAARLANKWAKSGLLEGLKGHDKSNMSMLLENQAKELIIETNTSNLGNSVNSGFSTGTGYQWAGVALPMVRKIFGQVVAKEFVSVQPMQMPTGLIFYLDFQYGTTKAPFSKGDSMYGDPANGFGNSNFDNKAEGGYYGAGRFGYSRNEFSASGLTPASATPIDGANYYLINFDSRYTASMQAGEIFQVTFANSAVNTRTVAAGIGNYTVSNTPGATTVDTFGVQAFYVSSVTDGITPNQVLADYTTIDTATTTFYVSSSAAPSAADFKLFYFKNGSMNPFNVGDYEAGNNLASGSVTEYNKQIDFPELNIKLISDSITAETRKLKAQWTPEFAQDLNAYQNLDAEAELTSMLSEQISMEIDLEILGMLISGAAASNTEYWSAKVANNYDPVSRTFVQNAAGVYYNQMSWFQTLGIKLQKISNSIHQKTLRGGANFMVISPSVATILESIPGFAADNTDAETMKYAFGVQKIGSINGRYKVYKNPYMKWNTILLGYKGTQFLETGAVYAPYVPLIMTPLIYDPQTFTPRKGVMTRYAKKMLRPDYYGKIEVADLDIV
jgi:hypothetical protein